MEKYPLDNVAINLWAKDNSNKFKCSSILIMFTA